MPPNAALFPASENGPDLTAVAKTLCGAPTAPPNTLVSLSIRRLVGDKGGGEGVTFARGWYFADRYLSVKRVPLIYKNRVAKQMLFE